MRSADEIVVDLSEAERAAGQIRDKLLDLRQRYDLARYEYTRAVRVAPNAIPHSHPVLTLNTRVQDEAELLLVYLHEQMHWYLTWFSHAHPDPWRAARAILTDRYPSLPTTFPEGAHTRDSSQLHLMVNWLELEAGAVFLGRPKAVAIAEANFVYRGIYRIVLSDWGALSDLYREYGLSPIRPATDMGAGDLELAARSEEAVSA